MEQDISLKIVSNHILRNPDMCLDVHTKVKLKALYHYNFEKYHKLRELSRDENNLGK